jgi:phage terminase large subunit
MRERARREKARAFQRLKHTPLEDLITPGYSLVMDPTHRLYCLLHQRARYKVLWGGRASAKSWGVAEALIRRAAKEPIRVLCAREFQNSIRDSSHKLLKDTIDRLGLKAYFDVTREAIVSASGAEFLFKGLFNNEQTIKSTEGVDICWVEEAQTVSKTSWDTLDPTIRKPGSELWVTYNLLTMDDATHNRFVLHERSDSLVYKLNFDSNPFFWESPLVKVMEDDKRDNFHLYEHIWLGMPLTIDDSIVFSGKYVSETFPEDLWQKAERLHFGADFGYAADPSTLIREFVWDDTLFIEHEAWGQKVELDEFGEFYGSVPESHNWPIYADCARPETISHIRRNWGFNVIPCDKWQGCVEDGIAHIRKFKKIVVHPRCPKTLEEMRLYSYKVDRITKEVLPILIDRNNHCCDGIRYGLNGHIQKSGELGVWERLGLGAAG